MFKSRRWSLNPPPTEVDIMFPVRHGALPKRSEGFVLSEQRRVLGSTAVPSHPAGVYPRGERGKSMARMELSHPTSVGDSGSAGQITLRQGSPGTGCGHWAFRPSKSKYSTPRINSRNF